MLFVFWPLRCAKRGVARATINCSVAHRLTQKKAPCISAGRFCVTQSVRLLNNDKVRVTLADHALRVGKTVHINRDPAAVYEHEVAVPDQSEMARSVSLDEELFRMPSET